LPCSPSTTPDGQRTHFARANSGARQGGPRSRICARKNPEFTLKYIIVGVEFSQIFQFLLQRWDTHQNQDPNKNISVENELKDTIVERDSLLLEISNLKDDQNDFRNTIELLEAKLERAESGFYEQAQKHKKNVDDKTEEIKVFKSVVKNSNDEILRLKNDCKDSKKLIKSNEKEIHNLENKTNNQLNTISNLKNTNKQLKDDVQKLQKSINKSKDKVAKKSHVNFGDSNGNEVSQIPPIYSCYACDTTLTSKVVMKDHIERIHVEPKSYQCNICRLDTENENDIIKHKGNDQIEAIKVTVETENTTEKATEGTETEDKPIEEDNINEKDWTETYPTIAALVEKCNDCLVSHSQDDFIFNFNICDNHRPEFEIILSNLKELHPILR
jgi:DNA repair exonuclease SbcCD ATPase subunit